MDYVMFDFERNKKCKPIKLKRNRSRRLPEYRLPEGSGLKIKSIEFKFEKYSNYMKKFCIFTKL